MNTAHDVGSGDGLAAVRPTATPTPAVAPVAPVAPVAAQQSAGAPPAALGDIRIRRATHEDLDATSLLQITLLDLGLFSRLGVRFVRRWHSTYLSSPFGIALVAQVRRPFGLQTVGFLIGTSDEAAHMEHVLGTRRRELLIAGLLALIRRPRVAVYFGRTRARRYLRRLLRRRPAGSTTAGQKQSRQTSATTRDRRRGIDRMAAPEAERIAVLAGLAVAGPGRSNGAGTQLTAQYLEFARAGGAQTARLVTQAGRGSAAAFYERLGWSRDAERKSTDGVPVIVMSYRLDRRPEPR